jgi:hypothetical protein
MGNAEAGRISIPLRLFDCFLLVTSVVLDALGISLLAECGAEVFVLADVRVRGARSGHVSTSDGDKILVVTLSAISSNDEWINSLSEVVGIHSDECSFNNSSGP